MTGTAPDDPDAIALAEYKQIKTEQASRIGTRDNLLYATMVAVGAVLAGSHSPARYLLISPVTFILGWNYLVNDHMITMIGRCFGSHPALQGLRWETGRPADARRASRKTIQLGTDLAAFCGSPLTALIAFWASPAAQSPALDAVSAAEFLATVLLAWQFTAYSERFSRRNPQPQPQPEQEN